MRGRLIPARRAASAFPPTAYTWRPNVVRSATHVQKIRKMITRRNASGKPRSLFAQITAPNRTPATRAIFAPTRTRLSLRIPWRRRLTTPDKVASAKSADAPVAMIKPSRSVKK